MRRQLYAGGGVTRQHYGLGSLVRKAVKAVTRPVKQIMKSPIGKAALLGATMYGLGGGTFLGRGLPGLARGAGGTTGFQMGNIMPNIMNYMVGQKSIPNIGGAEATKGFLGAGGKFSLGKTAAAGAMALAAIPSPIGTEGFNMAQRKGEVEQYLRRYYKDYYENNWQEGWTQEGEDDFVTKYTSEYNQGGRVGLRFGTPKEGIKSLDAGAQSIVKTGNMETEDSDEAQAILMARYNPGSIFSSSEITRLYRDPSLTTNMDRKQLHKILKNPGMFPEAENELKILLRRNRATGGRVGLYAGTDPEDYPEEEEDLTLWELQQEEGVPIGPMAGVADYYTNLYSKYAQEIIQAGGTPMSIEDFIAIMKEQERTGGAQGGRVESNIGGIMGGRVGLKVLKDYFNDDEEEYAQGGRVGLYAGTDPEDYPEEEDDVTPWELQQEEGVPIGPMAGGTPDPKHFEALFKMYINMGLTPNEAYSKVIEIYASMRKDEAKGGRIRAFGGGVMGVGTPGMRLPGIPQMAPDGLEYNMKAGGFQNLGAQEGKDDVNAKLAKNEFVMTADAVRGAGDGNIEVGAQKMYGTMKRLEGKVA